MSNNLKVNIRGINFTVKILSESSFDKNHGKHVLAVTIPSHSLMVFRPSSINLGIVRHEIVHAYMAGSLTDTTANLSLYDLEEIFAETFRVFGPDMIKRSSEVYQALKKIKGKKWK